MYKIFADGALIYDSTLEDYKIGKGQITRETDKSGSFVFSLYPDHPYYDSIVRRKTVITVYKSGRIVFRGVVLDDVSDYWNNKVITCAGERDFLNDSIVRPYTVTGTPEEVFKYFIEAHNAQVDEFKRFKIGTCTVVDANGAIARSNEGYESTLANMTSRLLEDSTGGHFFITHGDDGQDELPTIHYLADFTNVASQAIEFGVNLKNYTKTVKADEIATAIIPLGATIEDEDAETEDPKLTIVDVNDGVDYVYSSEGVAMYGWIFKVVEWDDVTDPANLKAKAEAELAKAANVNVTIDLTAVDMHLLDRSIESYNLGDRVRVRSVPHGFDATLLCNKQTLDVLKPENDTVTLGHTYMTFTERSNKAATTVVSAGGVGTAALNKLSAATNQNSSDIVNIIARLEALEGVTVLITASDFGGGLSLLLNSLGALTVAGQAITETPASIVVTGGSAVVSYTLTGAVTTPRQVTVNGVTLGVVSAAGDTVTTAVQIVSGTTITVDFTRG